MLRAMAWKKPAPETIATFEAVLPGAPAERRMMFGYPAAFVNGNVFMGPMKGLAKWVDKALAYGQSLPPKAKKPTKKPVAKKKKSK